MKKGIGWKIEGVMSVQRLRNILVEEGWSPDFFQKFDVIDAEIKKLELEFSEVARKKIKATDKKVIAELQNEINSIGLKISNAKLQLEELLLEEELRVDDLLLLRK